MMGRVVTCLPSTSNVPRSLDSHGNEPTLWRHDAILVLIRVEPMMVRTSLSFETALQDGFRQAIRLVRRRANHTDGDVRDSERSQYGATLENCGCSETCHLATIYRTTCPCSHCYRMGAEKPALPGVRLDLGEPGASMTTEIEHVSRAEAARLLQRNW
jgi:hypothetical protein